MFAYTLTPESVNLLIGGKPRTVHKSHVNYAAILAMLKDKSKQRYGDMFERGLLDMIDVKAFIAKVTEGRVQVSDDDVLFNGKKTHGVIRDRIITHLAEGFDIRPLARFLDKLMENPTESSRDDLYLWLEHSKMPICEDGDFLAYKYVRSDYMSSHDGKTLHTIGQPVSMPREQCDTSRHNTCSTGLHFCSYDYMRQCGGGTRHLILKINPRDVTAIPPDYNNAKGRCCLYMVIGEVEEEQKFPPLVKSYGTYEEPPYSEPLPDPRVEQLAEHYGDPPEGYYAEGDENGPDYDRHQGCGCGTDDEPEDDDNTGCGCAEGEGCGQSLTGEPPDEELVEFGDRLVSRDHWRHPNDPPPIPKAQKPKAPAIKLVFQHKQGKSFTAAKLCAEVDKLGQRGFAKAHNVPRTTLQGWLRTVEVAVANAKRTDPKTPSAWEENRRLNAKRSNK